MVYIEEEAATKVVDTIVEEFEPEVLAEVETAIQVVTEEKEQADATATATEAANLAKTGGSTD